MPDLDPTTVTDADDELDDSEPVEGILVRLQKLPKPVLAYLYADSTADVHQMLFDRNATAQGDRNAAYDAELETFIGEITLDNFPDELRRRLGWDESKNEALRQLTVDILGYVFLPAESHLGDVEGLLKKLGGDVSKYPATRLATRQLSYAEGAAETVSHFPEFRADSLRRFTYIVESRLRNVRDDVETKEMLTKSLKTGGLELDPKKADEAIEMIRRTMRMTRFSERSSAPAASPDDSGSKEPVAAEEPPAEVDAAAVKRRYVGTEEEREAIASRIKKYRDATQSETVAMRDALLQLLYPDGGLLADPLYVVAALLCVAEDGELSDILTDDERFRDIVRSTAIGGATEIDAEAQAVIDDFESNPTAKIYANLFLQVMLRGYADFSEGESARFGLRIANAAAKAGDDNFSGLVAFDAKRGDFAWTELASLEERV